jgi:nucleoside-diphosphate-sugar epimerase
MKVLFVGGTGIISSACAERALGLGMEVWLLNRGRSPRHTPPPEGARLLTADASDTKGLEVALGTQRFDAVVDFIAYVPKDVERGIEVFGPRTRQYVFLSSASAYQKPPAHWLITESTPLANPFWQYSRDKIACEERLIAEHRTNGFPVTIVRPSLTYGLTQIPVAIGSWARPYTIVDRMRRGERILVPGDGTSLWTVTWNADFARGLVGLLGLPSSLGHAFHITSDEVLTWDQIYASVAEAAGVVPRLVHVPSDLLAALDPSLEGSLLGDKAHSAVFDNSKIKRFVPDFVASTPFAQGIRKTVAWFDADPARREIDDEANADWDRILAVYDRALGTPKA